MNATQTLMRSLRIPKQVPRCTKLTNAVPQDTDHSKRGDHIPQPSYAFPNKQLLKLHQTYVLLFVLDVYSLGAS